MSAKTGISLLAIIFSFIYLPMAWYMSYLVYMHIHATELMWFLYWVNIPFGIIITIIGATLNNLKK